MVVGLTSEVIASGVEGPVERDISSKEEGGVVIDRAPIETLSLQHKFIGGEKYPRQF